MIKTITGLISVKFLVRNNKIFQYFIIEKKKGVSKYLLDTRFVVYDKLQEKIKSQALSNDDNFSFVSRRDGEDRITLEFDILDVSNFTKPNNYYFVIPGFVPSNAGCEYCKFKKDLDNDSSFFYCSYKDKTFGNKLKNCQFYKQPEDLFKT